ncbi:hypothetical protein J1N35_001292 [Gossypium stocksii]|uniref:Uncharacterized protein n=1 Tax=Gossypium stocksii TaxID=47602 RepID=A0A9D3WJU8_9ROSI|nr:hypothetical protein J1N35_001292 [Gossypium stocksii]
MGIKNMKRWPMSLRCKTRTTISEEESGDGSASITDIASWVTVDMTGEGQESKERGVKRGEDVKKRERPVKRNTGLSFSTSKYICLKPEYIKV